MVYNLFDLVWVMRLNRRLGMPDELFLFGEDVSQVATPPIIARSGLVSAPPSAFPHTTHIRSTLRCS